MITAGEHMKVFYIRDSQYTKPNGFIGKIKRLCVRRLKYIFYYTESQ